MIEHHTLRLMRDDLWARLTPLDRYGPADFASVLVDGVLAPAKKDPEPDKADKEDERALLSAFVAIVATWAAAFLLA